MNAALTPPSLALSLTDLPRSGIEAMQTLVRMGRLIEKAPRGDGHPVLALPGYGGADGSMAALRHFLTKIGYDSYALELGRNFESSEDRIMRIEDAVAFRRKMTARVVARLRQIRARTNRKVTLVGWSMGGLYALDASQQEPSCTRQVITLGSPFGDPRGTSTFKVLRTLNRSRVPIEEQNFDLWTDRMNLDDNGVPVKVLHSSLDGIVGRAVQTLPVNPNVEHIRVRSSHCGFAVNPGVLETIARII